MVRDGRVPRGDSEPKLKFVDGKYKVRVFKIGTLDSVTHC